MSRRDILRRLIDERFGGNAAAFSRTIGKAPAQVHQWLTGHRMLGDAGARSIEIALHLPQGFFDSPHAVLADRSIAEPHDSGYDFQPVQRVDLKVSAGVTGFSVEVAGERDPIFFRANWLASKGWKHDKLLALRVIGDSMEPSLWQDDLVVINTLDTVPRDRAVFAVNYEGEAVIKRLRRDAGQWWLDSDNPLHKPKLCDEHAIIIGRVVYKQSEVI